MDRLDELACDVAKFTHKLCHNYLVASFKNIGTSLKLDSKDFLFYYVNFRKFLKKDEDHSQFLTFLTKEDIIAIRFYSHFCQSLFYDVNRKRNIVMHDWTHYTNSLNAELKSLFCLKFLDRTKNARKEEPFTYPFGVMFSSNSFLPAVTKIFSNNFLQPYIEYRLVFHKSRKMKRRAKTLSDITLENFAYDLFYELINSSCIVKPSLITKLVTLDPFEDKALNIISLMLSKLSEYCKDPKKVKALQVLYECRYSRSLNNVDNDIEKKVKQTLHLEGDINPMVYGLVGKRNGYALNHICKSVNRDFTSQIISKYNLPINIASILFIEKEAKIKDLNRVCGLRHSVLLYEDEKAKEEQKNIKDKAIERKKILQMAKNNKKKKTAPQVVPKKKKKKIVALPKRTPTFTGEHSYIITCPALEIVKTFGVSAKIGNEIEHQILSIKIESKK